MNRLFVALKLPEEIKNKILLLRKEVLDDNKYNWQSKDKFHITLKFIGDIEEKETEKIAETLKLIQRHKKFNCSLSGFRVFFNNNNPSILWIGINLEERIKILVDEINKNLLSFNIPVDKRRFKAHLTLLRISRIYHSDFLTKFQNFEVPNLNFTIDEAALFKSELLPGSSHYTEIKKYNLN